MSRLFGVNNQENDYHPSEKPLIRHQYTLVSPVRASGWLAANLQYSHVIAASFGEEVAPGSTEEANREETRTGNYGNRSDRLRTECEGGFAATRQLDCDHEFEWQRDAGDFAKSRVGGAAGRLELDFVYEYRQPVVRRIHRAAERNRGDI